MDPHVVLCRTLLDSGVPEQRLTTLAKDLGVQIEAMRRALATLSGVREAATAVPPGLLAFQMQLRTDGGFDTSRAAGRLRVPCARNIFIEVCASAEEEVEHRLAEARAALAMTEGRLRRVKEEIEHLTQGRAA